MWIYAHWHSNGTTYIQPFHRPEKAAEHAFTKIAGYVAHDSKNYGNKNMPKELTMVKVELERLVGERTIENATKLIALYEDYARVVVGRPSPYHEIRDVKIVE